MSFLLKIVEGPNKGAEAALVEGVAITVGKLDTCDIVLADAALPDAPAKIEATGQGVFIDGEQLEMLHVKTIGETSFAVGPAEGAWGELVWPAREKPAEAAAAPAAEVEAPALDAKVEDKPPAERKSRGCLVGLVLLILLLIALVLAGCFCREKLKPLMGKAYGKAVELARHTKTEEQPPTPPRAPDDIIDELARQNGLDKTEENGQFTLSGNLKTRAERLSVTAEAYAAMPCIGLNLSDDETLKTAVEDTLLLIGEAGVQVETVTNRVAVLQGSCADFPKLEARLLQEVPRLAHIAGNPAWTRARSDDADTPEEPFAPGSGESPVAASKGGNPSLAVVNALPVCGILTTPYPCLVTRTGARILEGASIGAWTVVKIEADTVLLEGPSGRFSWQP